MDRRLKKVPSSHLVPSSMGLRFELVVVTFLSLAACGGGGSGGSGQSNNSNVTMYISPQTISVSAMTTQPAPTASFQVNVTGLSQGQTVYLKAVPSTYGISTVANPGGALPATITIEFKSPATLGVGTYDDTVQVEGCLDQACSQQMGSSPQTVTVTYTVIQGPPPALNSVSPTNVTAGGPPFMLTALGANFTSASVIRWNGADQTTTYVSSTELTAQIPASDISTTGTASIVVYDHTNPAGTTAAKMVNIVPASIDAVSYQMNPAHTGAVNFASMSFPSNPTWSVNVGGTPSYALIADGKVIVTVELPGNLSEILALDQATGTSIWGPIMISGSANATYDNGRVFVLGSTIGSAAILQAFDMNTGAQLWDTVLTPQYSFQGAPTASDGKVYVDGAGIGNTIYAVDESTGAVVWIRNNLDGTNNTPTVTADGIYISFPCTSYDLNPATGESVWQNNTGCSGGGGAMSVVANQLDYAPTGVFGFSGNVLDSETGANKGSYVADSPPAFTTTMGYFLQGGTLHGITLSNNTIQWSFTGDGNLAGSPICVNQYVFIGSGSGNLYALDGTTGAQVWNVNLGATIAASDAYIPFSGLAAGDGLLIVPAGTTVTAYTLSTNP